jgi:glutamate 5-kinase
MEFKRVVIKIGSSVLTDRNRLVRERIMEIVELVAELKDRGIEVIIVSSGAVAAGYTKLKLDKSQLHNRQALASIGQSVLMGAYQKKFDRFDRKVAQILLTEDDFKSKDHLENSKNSIDVLLKNGVVPIINENDAVAVEELRFGDNDQLSAHSTYHFGGDLLIILSDIDGYYTDNPRDNPKATVRKTVSRIEDSELQQSVSPNDSFATGGIVTKLKAGDFLIRRGLPMLLTTGFDLTDARNFLLNGKQSGGTLFRKV